VVNHLPTPEPGKQYQLRAIVDGKLVDAGMEAGGSAIPTLTAMYAMGKV
jgi:hypothetical protein